MAAARARSVVRGHAGAVLAMTSVFDPSVPNMARIYNCWLGGKDNISQVVPAIPYSTWTAVIQACQAHYSKITASVVRSMYDPSLSANVRFFGRGFLTLA